MIAPHALGGFPILSLTLFIPLIGALIIIFAFRREQTQAIKNFAFVITFIDFLVSLPILLAFDTSTHQFQFVEQAQLDRCHRRRVFPGRGWDQPAAGLFDHAAGGNCGRLLVYRH